MDCIWLDEPTNPELQHYYCFFFAVPFSDMVCLPQPGGIEHQWDTCVLSPLQTS